MGARITLQQLSDHAPMQPSTPSRLLLVTLTNRGLATELSRSLTSRKLPLRAAQISACAVIYAPSDAAVRPSSRVPPSRVVSGKNSITGPTQLGHRRFARRVGARAPSGRDRVERALAVGRPSARSYRLPMPIVKATDTNKEEVLILFPRENAAAPGGWQWDEVEVIQSAIGFASA